MPVILGGPHASLYPDELVEEHLGDWIFVGNADPSLPSRLHDIKEESRSVVIKDPPPDIHEVPKADFALAWGGYSRMIYRPIQMSRRCPYACSFCNVKCITTRKIQYRDVSMCLDEIQDDVRRNPGITLIRIVDDCPTFDLPRFKQFLRDSIARSINRQLHIDNLRGDGVDDEMLDLLKVIGVDHRCVGVESGNHKIFNLVNKGETLDQIIESAQMIKRHGFRLYTCFIIGLPGATPETDMDSIRLVRRLRPNWVYWCLFQPQKGTKAREWFEHHGTVSEEEGKTGLSGLNLSATKAPCASPDYPAAERSRMQVMALLMTGWYLLNPLWLVRMARTISRYRLWKAFCLAFAVIPINKDHGIFRLLARLDRFTRRILSGNFLGIHPHIVETLLPRPRIAIDRDHRRRRGKRGVPLFVHI